MTKEQFLTLKQELKTLAWKIKAAKPLHKQKQREFSLYEKKHTILRHYTPWCAKRNAIDAVGLYELRFEFRHKCIVYGMIRGLPRYKVEPKRTISNMRDETYLHNLLRQYGFPTKRTQWWNTCINWRKVGPIHEKAKRAIAKDILLD